MISSRLRTPARLSILRDDRRPLGDEGPHQLDVAGTRCERECVVADPEPHADLDRRHVLVGDRAEGGRRVHDHGPVRLHPAAVEDHGLGLGVVVGDVHDLEERPVEVDVDEVAGPHRGEHRRRPQRHPVVGADDVGGAQRDGRAGGEDHALAHLAAADLGALGVEADRGVGVPPDQGDRRLHRLGRGVGEVDAEEVDASLLEGADDVAAKGSRPKGAEDLDLHGERIRRPSRPSLPESEQQESGPRGSNMSFTERSPSAFTSRSPDSAGEPR